MHFLSLLLLFTAAVSTASMTDLWYSDVGVVHYTVYPIDPRNATATAETEILLRSLDADVDVISTRTNDVLTSWSISSKRSNFQSISDMKGVNYLEEDKSHVSAATTRPEPELLAELARRDVRSYSAGANMSSDAAETEKYLRSKIQPGKENNINQMILSGKIIGWAGLVLDDTAKAEVANHAGVSFVAEDLKVHPHRALPTEDWSQISQTTAETFDRGRRLSSRSGKWMKQEDADLALAVDSQYP